MRVAGSGLRLRAHRAARAWQLRSSSSEADVYLPRAPAAEPSPASQLAPARTGGVQHHWFNWHALDHPVARFWTNNQETSYHLHDTTSAGISGMRYDDRFWDRYLSTVMYAGHMHAHSHHYRHVAPTNNYINDRLFARMYWNTNIGLYYWQSFHLNFYYIERRNFPLKSVFSDQFVHTPRWAYNLCLLYTNYPYWNYIDIGLRQKAMLYTHFHVWLVFKFKMYKVARMNGIERGVQQRVPTKLKRHVETSYWERAGWDNYAMANQEPINHMILDNSQHPTHNREGAGAEHKRNYAATETLAGPQFAREHITSKPWWWHAFPRHRSRWEGWNPFGHDMVNYHPTTGVPLMGVDNLRHLNALGLNRAAVSAAGH